MSNAKTPSRPSWTRGPLYIFMMDLFPDHRTFINVLDVVRIARELGKSHEAVYKWLRAGRLTPDNAAAIRKLAAGQEKHPRQVDIREFDRFVYA